MAVCIFTMNLVRVYLLAFVEQINCHFYRLNFLLSHSLWAYFYYLVY